MSLFLGLPNRLISIVIEWIDLKSFATLDYALANHDIKAKVKVLFYDVSWKGTDVISFYYEPTFLKSNSTTEIEVRVFSKYYSHIEWLNQRNIHFQSIDIDIDNLLNFYSIFEHQEISIDNLNDIKVSSLISEFIIDVSILLIRTIQYNSSLTSLTLHITSPSGIELQFLQVIAKYCINLTNLYLDCNPDIALLAFDLFDSLKSIKIADVSDRYDDEEDTQSTFDDSGSSSDQASGPSHDLSLFRSPSSISVYDTIEIIEVEDLSEWNLLIHKVSHCPKLKELKVNIISCDILNHILHQCLMLSSLHLEFDMREHINITMIHLLQQYNQHLFKLVLVGNQFYMNKKLAMELSHLLPRLQYFKYSGKMYESGTIEKLFLKSCLNLRQFILSYDDVETSTALITLQSSSTSSLSLATDEPYRLTHPSNGPMNASAFMVKMIDLKSILDACPHLTALRIVNYRLNINQDSNLFTNRFENLYNLCLTFKDIINVSIMLNILQNCQYLTNLDLRGEFTAEGLMKLIQHSYNLSSLTLFGGLPDLTQNIFNEIIPNTLHNYAPRRRRMKRLVLVDDALPINTFAYMIHRFEGVTNLSLYKKHITPTCRHREDVIDLSSYLGQHEHGPNNIVIVDMRISQCNLVYDDLYFIIKACRYRVKDIYLHEYISVDELIQSIASIAREHDVANSLLNRIILGDIGRLMTKDDMTYLKQLSIRFKIIVRDIDDVFDCMNLTDS